MNKDIAANRIERLKKISDFLNDMKKLLPVGGQEINCMLDTCSAIESDYLKLYIENAKKELHEQ